MLRFITKSLQYILPGLMFLLYAAELPALGTYGRGQAVVRLVQFESRGIIFDSYEGVFEIATYDDSEDCDQRQMQCYTPIKKSIEFSVRKSNTELARFLLGNIQREMIIEYRIHRIRPITLSTGFELLDARPRTDSLAADIPRQKIVRQTGSRHFSIHGKILQLDRRGTIVKTYEGLYYDRANDRVHPFSITNREMAEHVYQLLDYSGTYYIGISRAIVTGFRESAYDIFEINFDGPAGGIADD